MDHHGSVTEEYGCIQATLSPKGIVLCWEAHRGHTITLLKPFSWGTMDGTQAKKKKQKPYFARNQLVNPVMPILCDVYPELMLPAEHLWPWEPRSCRLGMPRQPEQRAHLAGWCVPWVPLDPPSAILCLTTLLLNGIIAIASM